MALRHVRGACPRRHEVDRPPVPVLQPHFDAALVRYRWRAAGPIRQLDAPDAKVVLLEWRALPLVEVTDKPCRLRCGCPLAIRRHAVGAIDAELLVPLRAKQLACRWKLVGDAQARVCAREWFMRMRIV